MPLQSKVLQKNIAETLTGFTGQQRQERAGDLLRRADFDQAGVIGREKLGNRAPARRKNWEPKGHRLDQIDRLVLVFIVGRKTKQIGFTQQAMLLLAGNKAEILNSVRRTRFRQQA